MIERVVLTAVLLSVGFVIYRLYHARLKARAQHQIAQVSDVLMIDNTLPIIMYFTTPDCMVCRYQQQPALDRLKADLGPCVEIVRVDATEDSELAQRWGVMTVPMTFVLRSTGETNAVNYGFADEHKLRAQLEATSIDSRRAEPGIVKSPVASQ